LQAKTTFTFKPQISDYTAPTFKDESKLGSPKTPKKQDKQKI